MQGPCVTKIIKKKCSFHCGFALPTGFIGCKTAEVRKPGFGSERSVRAELVSILQGRKVRLIAAALVFMAATSGYVLAEPKVPLSQAQLYEIDIPALNAADALNELAAQTGVTFLFPYDIAKARKANAIMGRYTIMEALAHLLKGSGLSSGLSDKGVLKISVRESKENDHERREAMKFKKGLLTAILGFFVGTGGVPQTMAAQGEGGASGSEKKVIEEIIVTAQKREQSLQEVPVSITAFTDVTIENMGAQKMDELPVPNLYIAEPSGTLNPSMSIRGIFSVQYGLGFDQAFGVYLDGVYVGDPRAVMNIDLYDIERFEVLRGPQGTLFGKNTVSGALNIVTKAPTNELSGRVEAELGDYDLRRVKVNLSVPIIEDVLAARFSVHDAKRDGYVDYVGNDKCQDCAPDVDTTTGRFQLLFTPTDKLKIRASVDYFDDEHLPYTFENNIGGPNGDTKSLTVHGDIFSSSSNYADAFSSRENLGASITADYVFDNGYTLTSLTGWRDDKRAAAWDLDYRPVDELYLDDRYSQTQFSQELRIASPADNWYDFVAGIYWFEQEAKEDNGTFAFGLNLDTLNEVDVESVALFGHANFHVTDKATLFGGLRYTDETKDATHIVSGDAIAAFGLNSGFQADLDAEEVSWKVGLQYALTNDVMTYASVARGFKSGGFDMGGFLSAGRNFIVSPEFLTSYELGLKSTLWDGRLRANLTLFYQDYEDLQVITTRPDPDSPTLTEVLLKNAAKVESKGLELELLAQLTDNLAFSSGIGYVRSLFEEFPGVTTVNGMLVDGDGNEVAYSPEWTFNTALDHELPLAAGGHWITHLDYRFWDNFYDSEDGGRNQFHRKIPAYGIFGARAGYRSADEAWGVYLWAKNLTDKRATVKQSIFSGGAILGQHFIEPRMWGVTANYNF